MKPVLIGLLAMGVISCASIKVEPPTQGEFEQSRSYNLPYEKVWIRAVDWFADHNVTIEKIEKTSGLLTAKYLIAANENYLDCGNINVSGILGDPKTRQYGSLNLTVREIDSQNAKVKANFFGNYTLEANDAWDGRLITFSGHCISTGNIEQSILSFIGN